MNSFPWFRYYSETPQDKKLDLVAEESEFDFLIVLGAWSLLLCIANESPVRGSLYVTTTKRYSNNYLSKLLRLQEKGTEKLLKLFIEYEMLEVDKNGAYKIKNFEKRQYKSDSSVERVRKYRQKKKEEQEKLEECNADETLHETLPFNSASASISDSLSELNVWIGVTGMTAYPSKARDEAPYIIRSLISNHGQNTIEYCKKFYQEWINRKYSKTNHGWLDWALAGEIPGSKINHKDNGKPTEYVEAWQNGELVFIPVDEVVNES